MGVKRDNVPFAGVNEGDSLLCREMSRSDRGYGLPLGAASPNKVAKAAKRTFAAGLDLLSLKPDKLQIHNS